MKLERLIPLVVAMKGDGVSTCIICGRWVRASRERLIHVVEGGAYIAHPDYDYQDPAADVGWHIIGPECANMFPSGWTLTRVESYHRR